MAKGHHVAISGDGAPLQFTPEQVQSAIQRAIYEGDLILAVFRIRNDVMVKVFGEPSEDIARLLDMVATNYRKAAIQPEVKGS